MLEQPIMVPATTDPAAVPILVERYCAAAGLTLAHRGTLARYPGAIHWHYRQGTQPGTLEITWWPAARRLWGKVAANRAAPWTTAALTHIAAALERPLTPLPT